MKIIGTQVHVYSRDEVDRRRGRGPGRSESDATATRKGPQTGTASRPRSKMKLPVVVRGAKVPERTDAQKATPHLPNELMNEIIGHLTADMQRGDAKARKALRGMRGMDQASHAGFGSTLQAHLLADHLKGDGFKPAKAMTLLGRPGKKGTILGLPAGGVQEQLIALLLHRIAEQANPGAMLPVVRALVALPPEQAKAVMAACSPTVANSIGMLWPFQSTDSQASRRLKALGELFGKRARPAEPGDDVVRSAIGSMPPELAAKALQDAVISTSGSHGQVRALMGDASMPGSILGLPPEHQLTPLRSLVVRLRYASAEEQEIIKNAVRALPDGIGSDIKQKAGVA